MQNNTFSTLFVGQNLIRLSEVDSTNDFLKLMVSNSEPLPEGTVIMADKQYAGRGQQEARWLAEPGKNLTISLYLRPEFLSLENQFFLNIAISNGVSECITKILGDSVKIKWPNDIFYKESKLGGILIENLVSGGKLKASIIGIGLNVNQVSFDDSIRNKAISISQILQRNVDLIKLLKDVCSHIEKEYLLLRSGRFLDLKRRYIKKLYRFGKLKPYRQNGEEIIGEIVDVKDIGLLVIKINNVIETFNFKEIEYLTSN